MKGRYDTFGEWSHSGEYFTIDSVTFPKDSESSYGGSSLVEVRCPPGIILRFGRALPDKEILGSEEPITIR